MLANRLAVAGLRSGLNETPSKGVQMEGRTKMGSRNGSDTEAVVGDSDGLRSVLMIGDLRENYIKTCSVRIVMYSQRHIC